MDILSWKNKQETGTIFLSVNLIFYLIVLGGTSLISIASSVGLVFIAVINLSSMSKKHCPDDDNYLYLSRETLEEVFVMAFTIGKACSDKVHKSTYDSLQVALALMTFSWLSELFGTVGLLWITFLLAFVLVPQYYLNKEIIHGYIGHISDKASEAKATVYEVIPRYKR